MIIGKCSCCGGSEITSYDGNGCVNNNCPKCVLIPEKVLQRAIERKKMLEKMKEEKSGITCEDALKAFSDLGEALRKEMATIEVPDTTGPPRMEEYSYECPECGNSMRFESKMIKIRCKKCDITFNPQIQRAIKEEQDWKILDVNCLPEIIENDCDIQLNTKGEHWHDSGDYMNKDFNSIIKNLKKNLIYRYRLTPTKKTHEEFAKSYYKSLETYHLDLLKERKHFSLATINDIVSISFIAGRKSMESE